MPLRRHFRSRRRVNGWAKENRFAFVRLCPDSYPEREWTGIKSSQFMAKENVELNPPETLDPWCTPSWHISKWQAAVRDLLVQKVALIFHHHPHQMTNSPPLSRPDHSSAAGWCPPLNLHHRTCDMKYSSSPSLSFPSFLRLPNLILPGRPAPRVTWWHDNVEISSLSHPSADEGVQAIVNQLFIGRVTREYLGAKLQCRAQGSKLVGAVVKEVTIQVHCELPSPFLCRSCLSLACSPQPGHVVVVPFAFLARLLRP